MAEREEKKKTGGMKKWEVRQDKGAVEYKWFRLTKIRVERVKTGRGYYKVSFLGTHDSSF